MTDPAPKPSPRVAAQPHNPLHGLTLEAIVTALQAHYGWDGLAALIPLRCFSGEPSVGSSKSGSSRRPMRSVCASAGMAANKAAAKKIDFSQRRDMAALPEQAAMLAG